MPIGSDLGINLPTQGANTGTWGTDLNTELQKVIDAVEALVPASSIDFSADFDLNSFALTGISYSAYEGQASVASLNSVYFDTSGEANIVDGSANVVQLTLNGALNTASNGGIGDSGGDYGTNSISFDWDGTRYNAKNGATADSYADIRFNSAILRDGSGHDITLDAPSIGASYTLTLPTAVPASTGLFVQGTTAGALSFSNSTAQDITLTGSADVKYPSRTLLIQASASASGTIQSDGTEVTNAGVGSINFPIPIRTGATVTGMTVYWKHSTVTAAVVVWDLFATDGAGGSTVVLAGTDLNGTGGAWTSDSDTGSFVTAAGKGYWIGFANSTGNLAISHVEVTYSRA